MQKLIVLLLSLKLVLKGLEMLLTVEGPLVLRDAFSASQITADFAIAYNLT